MGGHEDATSLGQGGNADGAAHVVGEDGEGGAVRDDASATRGGGGVEARRYPEEGPEATTGA